MSDAAIPENSLVLYKQRPARVRQTGEKLTLEIEGGETVKVRPKDVTLLHPGPLRPWPSLRTPAGDPRTAWEILAGETTTLAELAELAFGAFTPATAWAAWQLASEGVYFRGPRPASQPAPPMRWPIRRRCGLPKRPRNAPGRRSWPAPRPASWSRRTAAICAIWRTWRWSARQRSRVLRALGREESPENAYATLLELGAWDETVNPYPIRLGLNLKPPELPLPDAWRNGGELPGGPRLDLTHLPAYAIDDATTETPDDAVSYEPAADDRPARIWVHVADAAALVAPDSELDLEAAAARSLTLLSPGSGDADAAARSHPPAGPGFDRDLARAVVRHYDRRCGTDRRHRHHPQPGARQPPDLRGGRCAARPVSAARDPGPVRSLRGAAAGRRRGQLRSARGDRPRARWRSDGAAHPAVCAAGSWWKTRC